MRAYIFKASHGTNSKYLRIMILVLKVGSWSVVHNNFDVSFFSKLSANKRIHKFHQNV